MSEVSSDVISRWLSSNDTFFVVITADLPYLLIWGKYKTTNKTIGKKLSREMFLIFKLTKK